MTENCKRPVVIISTENGRVQGCFSTVPTIIIELEYDDYCRCHPDDYDCIINGEGFFLNDLSREETDKKFCNSIFAKFIEKKMRGNNV